MTDNALSILWHSRAKDCPGKTWWNAPPVHQAVARALRIDPAQDGAVYALAPFRYARIDGKHTILAAWPAPRIFDPVDDDWLGIEQVIAWDPVTNNATILDDDGAQLVGPLTEETATIYADPRAFLTDWAKRRAGFAIQRQAARQGTWAARPGEHDAAPGALIVGDLKKIRWPIATMPRDLTIVGADPREINKAILRAARLPRVSAASTPLRRAA